MWEWIKSLFGFGKKSEPAPVVVPEPIKPEPPVAEKPAELVEPDYIQLGKSKIGEREIPGSADNMFIVNMFSFTSIWSYVKSLKGNRDEVAWCKAFINWLLASCGYDISKSPSALATDTRKIGVPCAPQEYALAVWKHLTGSLKGRFHTNVLYKKILDKNGKHIGWECLGGNQSNSVNFQDYFFAKHELISTTLPQRAKKPQPVPKEVSAPEGSLATFKKGTPAFYEAAYKQMTFDRGYESQILSAAKRVLAGKAQYVNVQELTGVPWYMIGCIHNMESSCDFRGVLHNGERIIGTGKKTKLVPKGRGPFQTWKEAALDAIAIESKYKDDGGGWPLGHVLHLLELFNGAGYLKYHPEENSPYVWACSSINDGHGKYIADGKYSATTDTHGQVGCAVIIKQLELLGELEVRFS